MRFVYATDLHGNRDAIEQAFMFAQTEQADAIVFGGDLTPKSVAIKLARYSDSSREGMETEKENSLLGGEVIPLDMLEKKAGQATFSDNLRSIGILNEKVGSDALANYLERKGSIIIEQANQYYDFKFIQAEQVFLDKLIEFFQNVRLSGARVHLRLSDEEMEMVRDCLVEWFKKLEATWSEQTRKWFTQKCILALSLKQGNFEQLAPSKRIEECILCEVSGREMPETIREIEKLLCEKGGHLADYLLGVFRETRKQLFQAGFYKDIIEKMHLEALTEYSAIAVIKHELEKISCVEQGQANFIKEYFLPLAREWRRSCGNKPIYAMLGNDDIFENVRLLDEAEREGIICHLHNKVHEFDDDFVIAGYSFVETLPPNIKYRAWVKNDQEILSDLQSLQLQIGERRAIWAIHNPPIGYLDQVDKGSVGSKGVFQFLAEEQPALALLGHIHEAPRLANSCVAQLGKTICVNPGGEHNGGLQAVLINTKTLEIKRRNT